MNALLRAWGQIPVLIRAVVGGYILVQFGSLVTVLPVLGNLKFHSEIPWALPAVILICWGYWKYSNHNPGLRKRSQGSLMLHPGLE